LFLGALLGYVFYYTGSLWYAIAVHFANNAGAVMAYYAFQHGIINTSPDDWGTQEGSAMWVILSIFIGIAGWVYLRRLKTT